MAADDDSVNTSEDTTAATPAHVTFGYAPAYPLRGRGSETITAGERVWRLIYLDDEDFSDEGTVDLGSVRTLDAAQAFLAEHSWVGAQVQGVVEVQGGWFGPDRAGGTGLRWHNDRLMGLYKVTIEHGLVSEMDGWQHRPSDCDLMPDFQRLYSWFPTPAAAAAAPRGMVAFDDDHGAMVVGVPGMDNDPVVAQVAIAGTVAYVSAATYNVKDVLAAAYLNAVQAGMPKGDALDAVRSAVTTVMGPGPAQALVVEGGPHEGPFVAVLERTDLSTLTSWDAAARVLASPQSQALTGWTADGTERITEIEAALGTAGLKSVRCRSCGQVLTNALPGFEGMWLALSPSDDNHAVCASDEPSTDRLAEMAATTFRTLKAHDPMPVGTRTADLVNNDKEDLA